MPHFPKVYGDANAALQREQRRLKKYSSDEKLILQSLQKYGPLPPHWTIHVEHNVSKYTFSFDGTSFTISHHPLSPIATKLYKSPKSMLVENPALELKGFKRPPIPYLPTDWFWKWSPNVDDAFFEGLKWLSVATGKPHPTLEWLAVQMRQRGERDARIERSQEKWYHPADDHFVISDEEDRLNKLSKATGVAVAIAQPVGSSIFPQGLDLPPDDRPTTPVAFRWLAASCQELAPPIHLGRWAGRWYHLVPKKKKMLAWMSAEGVDWKHAHALLVKKGFGLDERGLIIICAFVRQVMTMGLEVLNIDEALIEMSAAAKQDTNPLEVLKTKKFKPASKSDGAILSLEWLDHAFQMGCNPLARTIASHYESVARKLNRIAKLQQEYWEDEEDARAVAAFVESLQRDVNIEASRGSIGLWRFCLTEEEATAIVKKLAEQDIETADQRLQIQSYRPKPVTLETKKTKRTPQTLRREIGFERTRGFASDSSDEEEDDESWNLLKDDLQHRQDWRLEEDTLQYENDDDWEDQATKENLVTYIY